MTDEELIESIKAQLRHRLAIVISPDNVTFDGQDQVIFGEIPASLIHKRFKNERLGFNSNIWYMVTDRHHGIEWLEDVLSSGVFILELESEEVKKLKGELELICIKA